jgi:hypothetical protein
MGGGADAGRSWALCGVGAGTAVFLTACGGDARERSTVAPATDAASNDADVDVAPTDDGPPLQVRPDPAFAGSDLQGDLATWMPLGIAIDSMGNIVVSGAGQDLAAPPGQVVRRFTPSGTDDATFGASGRVTLPLDASFWKQSVGCFAGGTIGILGALSTEAASASFAIRLQPDGTTDPSFMLSPTLAGSAGTLAAGLWQSDGTGVLLGTLASVAFTAVGSAKTTYGAGGQIAPASAGALAADGTLWTASDARVTRYLPSGAVDPSFGNAGIVDLSPAGAGHEPPSIQAIVLEPSGGAVVIGSVPSDGTYDVFVQGLTSTGNDDPALANGAPLLLPATGAAESAARLPDGRILVWTLAGDLFALGADGSFQGTWNLEVSGTLLAGAVDESERLVIAGIETADPLNSKWFVRRYLLW